MDEINKATTQAKRRINWTKVKQYNSNKRFVVTVDNIPICVVKGEKKLSNIISYLEGYDVPINDGKIKKILDKFR